MNRRSGACLFIGLLAGAATLDMYASVEKGYPNYGHFSWNAEVTSPYELIKGMNHELGGSVQKGMYYAIGTIQTQQGTPSLSTIAFGTIGSWH